MLESRAQHHVATPNNEMLVAATRHPEFRAVLGRTALNIPDSTGVALAARLRERVTGIDTMQALCAQLNENYPVFLLGAAPGVAARAAERLQRHNPRLRIAGTHAGSPRPVDASDIVERIARARPRVLFVAYGAPAQELWIDKHLKDLPSVRVAMGVGGAFDFIAGTKRRAPRWMRSAGLEWLWRFAKEPSRWKRMWNAVVVFPALCLMERKRSVSW